MLEVVHAAVRWKSCTNSLLPQSIAYAVLFYFAETVHIIMENL